MRPALAGDTLRVMSFAELKEEILKLSVEQKAELAAILHGWEDDEMIARAEEDVKAGRGRELP